MLRRLPISPIEPRARDPGALGGLAVVLVAGMAALGVGVQVEVRQEPEVEPRPPRQEALGEVERHAVGIGPQQGAESRMSR